MPVIASVWQLAAGRQGRAVALAGAILGAGAAATATAQQSSDTGYGLPPSAATGRTLSPPEEVDGRLLPGFYPGISVIATSHSNARRTTTNDQSDVEITISPQLVYRHQLGSNSELRVGYNASTTNFADLSSEDVNSQGLNAALLLNLGDRTRVGVEAGYVEGSEDRGSSAARSGLNIGLGPDEYEQTNIGANVHWGTRQDRLELGLGVTNNDIQYTNNDQSSRDRDRTALRGIAKYNISPKTSLLAEISQSDVDYLDINNNRDSKERQFTIGADWQPTVLTGFQVRIGQTEKDFDNPQLRDYEGTSYLGRVKWEPTRLTAVSAYVSRAVEESSDAAASFFVSDLIGVTVNHSLSERINLLAYYNNTDDDYSDGRLDKVKDLGAGLDFAMREWLSLNARVGRIKRDSNAAEVPFRDTFISLGVTAKRPEKKRR